jgi:archaellum biogenesis ATPase FlaH
MTNFANWLENLFNGWSGFTILFIFAIVTLVMIYRVIRKTSPSATKLRPSIVQKIDRSHAPVRNPFRHGNPVSPEELIGRDKELRRLVGRILTGQSTIITGSPRCGKTSVLQALIVSSNKERAKKLYGAEINQLIFSYFDAFTTSQFDHIQFWQEVLTPLKERIFAQQTDTPLFKAYQSCQNNQFKTDKLENLIAQINQAGWQLVLLIDEFDALLNNPILTKNQGEFFAQLRALLISLYNKGALVLVMTSFLSREQLNNQTQKSSRGSPYFNFMDQIVLGALSEANIDQLLDQGRPYFTDDDYRFIKYIAGGSPYFLQIAASILWESYQQGNESERQRIKKDFYQRVKETMKNIWESLNQESQSTFISVALLHIEKSGIKLPKKVDIKNISETLSHWSLHELEAYGFLIRSDQIRGGWRIYPSIFLLFIVSRLKAEYRDKLSNNVWEDPFTPKFYNRFF